MAGIDTKSAPYTSPSSLLGVIERYRDRGLTTPFDQDVMVKAGVSESLANRTLLSLKSLDLVDRDGQPTEAFKDLATARGEEYQARLASIIRDRYADVFAFVDPATDPSEKVQEAFRGYEPRGQRGRMVALFMGLCQAAGLIPETPKRGPAPRAPRVVGRLEPRKATKRPAATPRTPAAPKARASSGGALPPALTGLLDELPQQGEGWTAARRDQFLAVFRSVLDFSYPVIAEFDPYLGVDDDDDYAEVNPS